MLFSRKYTTIRVIQPATGEAKIVLIIDGATEEVRINKGTIGNLANNALKINQALNYMTTKVHELIGRCGEVVATYSFAKK